MSTFINDGTEFTNADSRLINYSYTVIGRINKNNKILATASAN